jgi:UDP-3-O-[3-hydroxymyristoyl] glucosamine N-acyltransferase
MSLKLQQLAKALKLEFRGDAGLIINGVASSRSARAGDLCFMLSKKYVDGVTASNCSAVILPPQMADAIEDKALLLSENPQYSFVNAIKALGLEPKPRSEVAIHPSAQISTSAKIGKGVSIGAMAVIEDDVRIGADTSVGAGTVIERSAVIGSQCILHSQVTLGREISLGDRCIIHSGAVIGADGYGLVDHEQQWYKIPQLGSVVIEDDVEIGANTTVDRGALDDTIIEQGCKLDNLIQIAHNVHIGAHTVIAACAGIAGSTRIGRRCVIAGGTGINGHINIADNVTITGASAVTNSIKQAGVYSSGTPLLENSVWHRVCVRYKSLDKLAKTITRLDKSSK